jgi:hypothetical protein
MCPAAGLDNPTAGEQLIEPGVAVGVNDAVKLPQMCPRVLPFAIGRVKEQRRRGARTGKRPLVTNIEPALAKAGVEVSKLTPSRAKISA